MHSQPKHTRIHKAIDNGLKQKHLHVIYIKWVTEDACLCEVSVCFWIVLM